MTLRSVFHRKTRGSDSDSTGYSSSSSIASSPLSASQFILRPHTVLSSYSNHSANEKFLFDPYSTPPSWDNSSRSSRTSSENEGMNYYDDGAPGHRRSMINLMSLKSSTTAKIAACKSVFSSLKVRPKKSRPSLFDFNPLDEDLSNTEDFLDFNESASSVDENGNVGIEDLLNALKMHEDTYPVTKSISSLPSTTRRKQIIIKEPDDSSKIYFDYRSNVRKPFPSFSRSCSRNVPRSILKKEPSLWHSHLYEEVEGDHLAPLPDDVRPQPPCRPLIQPIRLFPPCNEFQPRRLNRVPSVKRRQKQPSLHHKGENSRSCFNTWHCRLRQKIFHDE